MPIQSICDTLKARYDGRDFITVAEVAALLSIAPKTVQNHLAAGTFPVPSAKLCGRHRFAVQDLVTHLDELRGAESAPAEWKRRGPKRKVVGGGV
jgi:hypothetical protein